MSKPTPTERAFELTKAMIGAYGHSSLTAGDYEDAANEAVAWVNDHFDSAHPNAEQPTSIDEVLPLISHHYDLHLWSF